MRDLRPLLVLFFLLLGLLAGCAGQPDEGEQGAPGVIPESASVAELQQLMESGEASAEEIARASLARIDALDEELRAVIATSPEALDEARALDEERAAGEVRGPLHGIPVLLKDNIEAKGALPTTAGSLALADNVTGRDAPLVERLRDAGAVILGKANLSEWANFRSERSSSGWSAIGGQARNPYAPSRTPCGSSSGSGVAVAAGYVPLAVGTETNGSVVCPATVNGIVGIKPTVGLVSRRGIVPISASQDSAGPMTRSVADAALMLQAMIGEDEDDPATTIAKEALEWELTSHLLDNGLAGKRVGVLRSLTGYHEGVDAVFEKALEDMSAQGALLVDDLAFETPDGFWARSYDVLLYEFKDGLNAYLATLPDPELSQLTLEALIAFNEDNAERELKWFGQEIFELAQAKGPLDDPEYLEAREFVQGTTRAAIDGLLEEHELDLLVAPTGGPAWSIDRVTGDRFLGGASSFPAIAGYPHITVPMGQVHGLPLGLSFIGTRLSEPLLIEAAHAYEQGRERLEAPRLRP